MTSHMRVLAYNVWGMSFAPFKYQRMKALSRLLQRSADHYDVILLCELWLLVDYNIIKRKLPEGFHMTSWDLVNTAFSPGGSAGLAIISRFPFLEVEPMFFGAGVRGHLAALDGEVVSRKGALRVKIDFDGHLVDVVVTHLIGEILTGDPNCENDRDVNENHRQGQTKELLRFIESTCCNSDLVLLAGDFNFDKTHESYQLVTSANFEDTGSGEGDKRSTWGHPDNKSGNSPPHLLDYVFVRSNHDQIQVKATSTIPEKAFQFPRTGTLTSISDHSPVVADVHLKDPSKPGTQNPRAQRLTAAVDLSNWKEEVKENGLVGFINQTDKVVNFFSERHLKSRVEVVGPDDHVSVDWAWSWFGSFGEAEVTVHWEGNTHLLKGGQVITVKQDGSYDIQ